MDIENTGLALETQNQMILADLKKNPGGLTGMDMIKKYGAMSYTRRIKDLREKGYHIGDMWERSVNERGKEVKRWKRYFYVTLPSTDAFPD